MASGRPFWIRAIAHAESQGVESLFLEVRVSNESAYRLYTRRGFTQISVRKDYYQNPREDARILVKPLTPSSWDQGKELRRIFERGSFGPGGMKFGNTCSQFQIFR